MSFRIIQLENLDVDVKYQNDLIKLSFINASVKKTMEDAEQKTLWHQDGSIIMKGSVKENFSLKNKEKIISFNISFDFYTYKNMLILPFNKRGKLLIEFNLLNRNDIYSISCSEVNLTEEGDPRYIKHISKTE
jgi:hypothetical protein|tara:strand:- start:3988 stop:4386 length:399 start_codon:yes stop_codon:yes gene_type:complete